jgi:hypothetical protein
VKCFFYRTNFSYVFDDVKWFATEFLKLRDFMKFHHRNQTKEVSPTIKLQPQCCLITFSLMIINALVLHGYDTARRGVRAPASPIPNAPACGIVNTPILAGKELEET